MTPRGPDREPRKERVDKDRYKPRTCGSCPHDPHEGPCTHKVAVGSGKDRHFEDCGCTGS